MTSYARHNTNSSTSSSSSSSVLNQDNPLEIFMYALKAPESKRQYPNRLKVFLDFLTFKNDLVNIDLEHQCIEFITRSKTDSKWVNYKLMEFVLYQKERVYHNKIVYGTIRNYLKTNSRSRWMERNPEALMTLSIYNQMKNVASLCNNTLFGFIFKY